MLLLPPFYRQGNKVLEKLSNLPRVIQLGKWQRSPSNPQYLTLELCSLVTGWLWLSQSCPNLPFLYRGGKVAEGRSWVHRGRGAGKAALGWKAGLGRSCGWGRGSSFAQVTWSTRWSGVGLPLKLADVYPCLTVETVPLRGQANGTLLGPKDPESQKELLNHPKSFPALSLTMTTLSLYVQLEKHHTGLGKVQELSRGMTNGWDCQTERTLWTYW